MVINKGYEISLTIEAGSRKRSTDICVYDFKNLRTPSGTFSGLVGLLSQVPKLVKSRVCKTPSLTNLLILSMEICPNLLCHSQAKFSSTKASLDANINMQQ
jgi:hypothetical protein